MTDNNRNLYQRLSGLIIIALSFSLLLISLRGMAGNPSETSLNTTSWKDAGPFELSPERGKFALTYSMAENKSFNLSLPLARFATPDLGYINGHYASLFPPGVSIAILPGYHFGKYLQLSQIGSFAIIALAASVNAFLIRSIALRLNSHPSSATLSGLIFLFATPAYTYAVSLYQHHFSTLFILASLYLLLNFRGFVSLAAIWLLTGLSFLFDYPNLVLMLPISLAAIGRTINFSLDLKKHLQITIRWLRFPAVATAILPVSFLLYFNTLAYGNPYQLAGTVTQVKSIDEKGNPGITDLPITDTGTPDGKTAPGFFLTRNLLDGFYIHTISPDRGFIIYTPIIIFGLLGLFKYYQRHPRFTKVFPTIVALNLLLYSMWNDPWGGWAFGSRYLIPSYAILAIFIAPLLTRFRKDLGIILPFFLLLIYSIFVNTLGAITTSRNPPEVEVLALESITRQVEKFTFARNFDYLNTNGSKSYVYNSFLNQYISPTQYYQLLTLAIASTATFFLLKTVTDKNQSE